MAKFNKDLIVNDGMYVKYEGRFVARFKRGGAKSFISFLVKNFEVEEYFQLLATVPPLTVLETKGFVDSNTKRALKFMGFAPTQAGKKAYLDSIVSK